MDVTYAVTSSDVVAGNLISPVCFYPQSLVKALIELLIRLKMF